MSKELKVYSNTVPVGVFTAELQNDGHTTYEFRYLDDVSEDDLVSLTMPTEQPVYHFNTFPPAFDMILPEGERRHRIQAFKKIIDTDDFSLLSFVGNNAVNRVRFSSEEGIGSTVPILPSPAAIAACENGYSLFTELRDTFNENQGISGVMPKILGQSPLETGPGSVNRILLGSNSILKSSTNRFPSLGVNEALSLKVYKKAGLDTPNFTMSADGTLLQVERFDIIDPGAEVLLYKGFEEAASLMGETADSKYHRDYGTMIKYIEDVLDPGLETEAVLKLVKAVVLNWMMGNGDAHLKNFGILYEGANTASLSPFYDVVCTRAYIPDDIPALALSKDYYSKANWPENKLKEFAAEFGYLRPKEVEQLFSECRQAISETLNDITYHINHIPGFKDIGSNMLNVWRASL